MQQLIKEHFGNGGKVRSTSIEYPIFVHSGSISAMLLTLVNALECNDVDEGVLVYPTGSTNPMENILRMENPFDGFLAKEAYSIHFQSVLERIQLIPCSHVDDLEKIVEVRLKHAKLILGIADISKLLKIRGCLNGRYLSRYLMLCLQNSKILIVCETGGLQERIPIIEDISINEDTQRTVSLETIYATWIPTFWESKRKSHEKDEGRLVDRRHKVLVDWLANTCFRGMSLKDHSAL
ncbi:hypothetical protein POMI540_0202 [Schizosaccharomyces pombe]|uniref:Uncharacterized protein C22G7.03 n=1 Tax=Schizosaccharomyces pombe (strain 972 / ATCC 24843) TaxID=284812 RepID=YAA3_SCHPO|nr:uncharacterized protein SPAC22G7.03 [Schizosaccharomyces pombe]Q09797.1 RecName: Full=Uncharacterized protein C22G7.03 [Schizosaccharomyces pombe 972h-]CAA91127.1 sequence orphan [Schizosaccharomyces pombe]|eukprot:NP_593052.1 uncharacterized protein SPAC22G7.03 [Schizosaccharomyces pombe]